MASDSMREPVAVAAARGRLWTPSSVLLAVTAAAFVLYNSSPPAIADIVVFAYAACLVLGPSVLYPLLRRRGATVTQATAGALCVPAAWLLKECWAMTAIFSVAEAAFYALNPLSLGLFTAAALQMAVAELVLRRARRGRWELWNGAGLTCTAVALIAGAYAAVAREEGAAIIFWLYIAAYRYVFGG